MSTLYYLYIRKSIFILSNITNMKNYKFDKELLNAIKENNLILFVGAGASYELKNSNGKSLGGWDNLVIQILQSLEDEGSNIKHLKELASQKIYEPIVILDLIERDSDISRNDIIKAVKEHYTLSDDNDYSLHNNLLKLSNKIITTNYDEAFENIEPNFNRNTATLGKEYELANLYKTNSPMLLKLHGCIREGDKMVILPSDYNKLYENINEDAERLLFYLKNLITNKTILFIGCGMEDFQINNMFSEIKNALGKFNKSKHYIITIDDNIVNKLDFLKPISIDNYSELSGVITALVLEKDRDSMRKLSETIKLQEQLREIQEDLDNSQKDKETVEKQNENLQRYIFSDAIKYQLANNPRKAIEKYKVLEEYTPNSIELLNQIGIAYYELNDYKVSMSYLNKVIDIKPDHITSLHYLGVISADLNKNEDAISFFLRALSFQPDNFELLFNIGQIYADTSKNSEALEYYHKALKLKPNDHQTLYNIGKLYRYIETPDENMAIVYLKRALLLKPNHIETLVHLGYAHKFIADYKKAIFYTTKALKLAPKDYSILFNLGYSLIMEGEFSKAKEYLEQAYWLQNNDVDVLGNLGIVNYELNQLLEAVFYFEKALELAPNEENIKIYLERALKKLNGSNS